MRTEELLRASVLEYNKASRYLISSALEDHDITLDQAKLLSDLQHATLISSRKETEILSTTTSEQHIHISVGDDTCSHKQAIITSPSNNQGGSPSSVCQCGEDVRVWHGKVDSAMQSSKKFLESIGLLKG